MRAWYSGCASVFQTEDQGGFDSHSPLNLWRTAEMDLGTSLEN